MRRCSGEGINGPDPGWHPGWGGTLTDMPIPGLMQGTLLKHAHGDQLATQRQELLWSPFHRNRGWDVCAGALQGSHPEPHQVSWWQQVLCLGTEHTMGLQSQCGEGGHA